MADETLLHDAWFPTVVSLHAGGRLNSKLYVPLESVLIF